MSLTERHYVVRVSALLDRSTAGAAGDLVTQFDRAAKAGGRRISEEQRQAQRSAQERERAEKHVAGVKDRYFRDEQRKAEAAERRAERETTQRARREEAAAQRSQKAQERSAERAAEAKQRAEERAQKYVERIKDRHFREEQRKAEHLERQTGRERRERVKQIAGDAMGTAAAMGRKALGVAGEIAGGMGVDFSVGSGVSKAVQLEKLATSIVNSGNRGGKGAAERTADVGGLQTLARSVGNQYAFDPTQVLAGLAKYQALTGDLDTAKAGLGDLAKLAKGFNVDLDKMVGAAGQVGSAIGEVGEGKAFATSEEKAAAVVDVLKSLTAQGQEGAIEISDLAVQMAKVKAAGAAFEGSTADNIKKMGAMAQLSLQLGGSASATQAATSVMGFVSTLKTPARRSQFKAMGVDIDSATEKGAFADPFEIIKRSLAKTEGDPEKMKKLFGNVVGERAVTALTNTYNKAGGGDKGMAAVDEQFKRFQGTVGEDQLKENLARAMNTMESKATLGQNKVDESYARLAQNILPALEKLEPGVTKAIDAFGTFATWAANNPGAAITGAIVASIGKAAIGPMIGKALETSLGQKVGGTIAVGVASFMITKAIIENFADAVDKGSSDRQGAMNQLENAKSSARAALRGEADPTKVLDEQGKALAQTERRAKNMEDLGGFGAGDVLSLLGAPAEAIGEATGLRDYLNAANPFSSQTLEGVSGAREDVAAGSSPEALRAEIASLKASMDAVKAQLATGIKVKGTVSVDNLPSGGATPGRVGVPDQG